MLSREDASGGVGTRPDGVMSPLNYRLLIPCFEEGLLTDVLVALGGYTVPSHRLFLSLASPKLATFFLRGKTVVAQQNLEGDTGSTRPSCSTSFLNLSKEFGIANSLGPALHLALQFAYHTVPEVLLPDASQAGESSIRERNDACNSKCNDDEEEEEEGVGMPRNDIGAYLASQVSRRSSLPSPSQRGRGMKATAAVVQLSLGGTAELSSVERPPSIQQTAVPAALVRNAPDAGVAFGGKDRGEELLPVPLSTGTQQQKAPIRATLIDTLEAVYLLEGLGMRTIAEYIAASACLSLAQDPNTALLALHSLSDLSCRLDLPADSGTSVAPASHDGGRTLREQALGLVQRLSLEETKSLAPPLQADGRKRYLEDEDDADSLSICRRIGDSCLQSVVHALLGELQAWAQSQTVCSNYEKEAVLFSHPTTAASLQPFAVLYGLLTSVAHRLMLPSADQEESTGTGSRTDSGEGGGGGEGDDNSSQSRTRTKNDHHHKALESFPQRLRALGVVIHLVLTARGVCREFDASTTIGARGLSQAEEQQQTSMEASLIRFFLCVLLEFYGYNTDDEERTQTCTHGGNLPAAVMNSHTPCASLLPPVGETEANIFSLIMDRLCFAPSVAVAGDDTPTTTWTPLKQALYFEGAGAWIQPLVTLAAHCQHEALLRFCLKYAAQTPAIVDSVDWLGIIAELRYHQAEGIHGDTRTCKSSGGNVSSAGGGSSFSSGRGSTRKTTVATVETAASTSGTSAGCSVLPVVVEGGTFQAAAQPREQGQQQAGPLSRKRGRDSGEPDVHVVAATALPGGERERQTLLPLGGEGPEDSPMLFRNGVSPNISVLAQQQQHHQTQQPPPQQGVGVAAGSPSVVEPLLFSSSSGVGEGSTNTESQQQQQQPGVSGGSQQSLQDVLSVQLLSVLRKHTFATVDGEAIGTLQPTVTQHTVLSASTVPGSSNHTTQDEQLLGALEALQSEENETKRKEAQAPPAGRGGGTETSDGTAPQQQQQVNQQLQRSSSAFKALIVDILAVFSSYQHQHQQLQGVDSSPQHRRRHGPNVGAIPPVDRQEQRLEGVAAVGQRGHNSTKQLQVGTQIQQLKETHQNTLKEWSERRESIVERLGIHELNLQEAQQHLNASRNQLEVQLADSRQQVGSLSERLAFTQQEYHRCRRDLEQLHYSFEYEAMPQLQRDLQELETLVGGTPHLACSSVVDS